MNTKLSQSEINELVERAVQYGVSKMGQTVIAITLGGVWIDGYIAAHESLTEDDKQSLRDTINNYHFTNS